MSTIKTIIEHEGKEYSAELATVKRTFLGVEDHGIFTALLTLEWQSSGITIPGFSLDTPHKIDGEKRGSRIGTGYGLDHIMRILETVGVDSWEKLLGRKVYILFAADRSSAGIANADTGKVLIFKDHADSWEGRES